MKKILLLLLFLGSQIAMAQEEEIDPCVQNIEIAQQRYDEGRIQDIQALLLECLESGGYDDAQKSSALRLLTLSYIFLEDEDQAEATMLRLLEINHLFQVNAAIDPTEFINLHDQFRHKPLFNVGIRYIANLSQPIVSDLNSSISLTNNRPEYSNQYGTLGIGLNFEYEFYENLFAYPEIHYRTMVVARSGTQDGIVSGTTDYITIENFENQNWLSLPISVKYLFNFDNIPKLKLYANLGGSVDYLLKSEKPSDQALLQTGTDASVTKNIITTDDKNRLNFGVFAGGGVTWQIGEGFFSLEARYLYSLTDLTDPENILNPTDPAQLNTLIQDDVYRMNHIAVSFGYTMNIYMPKQLR